MNASATTKQESPRIIGKKEKKTVLFNKGALVPEISGSWAGNEGSQSVKHSFVATGEWNQRDPTGSSSVNPEVYPPGFDYEAIKNM